MLELLKILDKLVGYLL